MEDYFLIQRCKPELDPKKYRMNVAITIEDEKTGEEAIRELKMVVEIAKIIENAKYCVRFKRIEGDPFIFYKEVSRIRGELFHMIDL